ncbi:MAG TPA: hypothetical protein VFA46_11835 [Actinomycetes bacterium]|jgi:hypothetical protein|nr:hypothetical protein [Actinomycetes bacterium]
MNGAEPQPEPPAARDWRSGSAILVAAAVAVLTLVFVAVAVRELGPATTFWLVTVSAVAVLYARTWRVRHLTTEAFMHVKELTKAEQYEAYRAMRRRYSSSVRDMRRKRPLGRVIDEGGMHPPTLIRVAKPQRYVKLDVAPVPWPRLQDIRSVTVRWTPLVQSPSDDFVNQLTEAVAHFLCLSPRALVVRPPDLYRKRITFTPQ